MCDYTLFVYTPYYPSVGHCIRLLLSGLSTTSILIDEINSTLSFLYSIAILELYGNIVKQNGNY